MKNSKFIFLIFFYFLVLDSGIHDGWITKGTIYILNELIKSEIPVNSFWYDGGHTDKLHNRSKKLSFSTFISYI